MLNIISHIYIFLFRIFSIKVGKSLRVWPLVYVSKGQKSGTNGIIEIGDNCEISQGVILKAYGGKITIANNSFIGEYTVLYGHGGIEIGTNTLVSMHTCIVSSNHTIPNQQLLIRDKPDIFLPVRIGNDVWIGAGVKILGGTTIGNGCVIGAGAVVSHDLPPYSIAMGIPARVIKFRDV